MAKAQENESIVSALWARPKFDRLRNGSRLNQAHTLSLQGLLARSPPQNSDPLLREVIAALAATQQPSPAFTRHKHGNRISAFGVHDVGLLPAPANCDAGDSVL